jgi:protein-disulfide isomerase
MSHAHLKLPVDPERDHIQGPDTAAVTLLEYGDYECSYCGQAYSIVKHAQQRLGPRLRFVFRNFPLTEIHPHAAHAALAAEAAGALGKFWEMHDALYEHQRSLGDHHLRELAVSIGLDGDAVLEAVQQETFAERVREDFMSGVRSDVNGTPTFYINGFRHDGSWDEEALLAALEAAA